MKSQNLNLKYWTSSFPLVDGCYIGIDPGKNWGLTYIYNGNITSISGKLNKSEEHIFGIYVIRFTENLLKELKLIDIPKKFAYVEGAAYGYVYGQDMLAQIRFGFAYALYKSGYEVSYISPMSARKITTGNGKLTGSDLWKNVNPNASDSTVIALACLSELSSCLDQSDK